MAIVRFGTTVIGIRGTIAGVVFTQSPSGPVAKTWRRPKNQTTAIAASSRRAITPYGSLWAAMTTSLKNDWAYFAQHPPELDYNALGIQYWLTAYQWLVRINIRRASMTLAPSTAVPDPAAVTAPASATLTAASGNPATIIIHWPSGTFPGGHYPFLFLGAYPSTGLTKPPRSMRLVYSPIERPDTEKDISTLVKNRFGNIPAKWSLFANLHTIRYDAVQSIATPATCEVT